MKDYIFNQQSLGQIIEDKAETYGEEVFLQYENGAQVTFRECNEMANRIGNGLWELGLRKGDTLATLLPNSLESIFLWFGVAKAGIVDVPINLANKGLFLSHIINDCKARVLVIDQQYLDRLKFIENELPFLEKVVVWSRALEQGEIPALRFDVLGFDFLSNCSAEKLEVEVKGSEPQMIIYTSGTTGPAKGVMQSHTMIYFSAHEYLKAVEGTPQDIFFTCLPLFHANARILCVYPAMLLGTKVVIYEKFSASRFWEQIKLAKATIFNSLGAIANFIYNQPRKSDDANNPVRVCAAFPMPKQIYDDFKTRYNLKVVEGYGLTEVAIITYTDLNESIKGTCGKATSNFEVVILDENDWPVSRGTVGEIAARGRIPWVTALGYYNLPEKTIELVRNHYYHTGDLGYLDEEGYLYFVDRIKDYIRRRGENISSTEIERVVNSHVSVAESAAISVKSELSEDEVKIVVVLKEGENLTPQELMAFCEERMPYFAIPRYVEFLEIMPKTPNEKIQKSILREAGVTTDTWDREKEGYIVKK